MTPAEVPGFLGRVLTADGAAAGTCFQVVPGVLVTAWHVVGMVGADEVFVEELRPRAGIAHPVLARVYAVSPDDDVAVLGCERPLPESVPGWVASEGVAPGAGVEVTGVAPAPDGYASTHGAWSTSEQAGQLSAPGLVPEMSGAPVQRTGDGRVVGLVSGRYNSADDWTGSTVRVVRTEDLLSLLTKVSPLAALTIFEELGDRARTATCHGDLGAYAQGRGDHPEAERRYRHALAIFEELGDRVGMATSHGYLGMLFETRGDRPAAEHHHRQALTLFEDLGDRPRAAAMHGGLAILAQDRRDYPQAEHHHRQALTHFEDLDDRVGIATSHGELGVIAQARGDHLAAERHLRQALTVFEDLGDGVAAATTMSHLGVLAAATGRPRDAVPLHCHALAIRLQLGVPQARTNLDELLSLRARLGDEAFAEAAAVTLDEPSLANLTAMLDQIDLDDSQDAS